MRLVCPYPSWTDEFCVTVKMKASPWDENIDQLNDKVQVCVIHIAHESLFQMYVEM